MAGFSASQAIDLFSVHEALLANYEALAAHLRTIGTLTLRMTFAEVEAITGRLPPSSRTLPQWWENDPGKLQAREGWLAAGYETSSVSIKRQSLEFVRRRTERAAP